MSISEAKLEANRANAALSTGPTSRVGLARSAQNAIKHGLCSKFTVLESENQDDYNDLLKRFIDTEKPKSRICSRLACALSFDSALITLPELSVISRNASITGMGFSYL